MRNIILLFVITVSFLKPGISAAQTSENEKFTPAIEDNSMFLEEAYNQETGIVQHISNLVLMPLGDKNIYYSFTQEWPAYGRKHQLSYNLQLYSISKTGVSGFGDILINYRYQLSYKQNFVACAPRLSLIIPTGNHAKDLGEGSWGLQFCIPISKRWTNQFINHVNLGTTYYFKVKQEEVGFNHSLINYFAGISSIWLMSEKFNLMLEYMTYFTATPEEDNKVSYSNENIIAPAFRYAISVKNLQITPGISIPLSLSKRDGNQFGLFFYLSFEHPFK